MKRFLCCAVLLFGALQIYSQDMAPVAYTKAIQLIQDTYNNKDYSRLHEAFNSDMKSALPLAQAREVLEGLHNGLGQIRDNIFLRLADGTAFYRTSFEKGVLETRVHVDGSGLIDGLFFTPYVDETAAKARNTTAMRLPFKDEWFVFWGGDTEAQNYHVVSPAQKNAFDFIILDGRGQSYRTDRSSNADFYAFGKKIYAPCDAEVVTTTDGINDNKPGEMNPLQALGNSVILKTAAGEYIIMAHFKKGSVKVKTGDKVKQGQQLGLCGNSGNSSEPHLHFHLQNEGPASISATGIKCFFEKLQVTAKGSIETRTDYSPVKGEKVKP
jgi:murein DD-endopeptidase MepM/ murein hydrolase activator NlpD